MMKNMISIRFAFALVSACMVAGLYAEDRTPEELKALADSTGYGAQYSAFYLNLKPEQEVGEMAENNQRYLEELVRLNPGNPDYRIALGDLYIQKGVADKALTEFKAALDIPALSPMQQGLTLIGMANAAILKGDRESAVKYCEELVSRNLKTVQRYQQNPVLEAEYALQFLRDQPEIDYLKLPYYTGAKAFPKPQQAEYTDDFVPLQAVKLVLDKTIKTDDARIRLLKVKFERFGVKFDDNALFQIKINISSDPKAPENPEGYALSVTKDTALINGHDAQGVLWGIVSLIQLVDLEKAPKIRVCEIVDWPDTARRGFLQYEWKDALEFMLFSKMNTVVSQRGPQLTFQNPGKPWSPLQKEICAEISSAFTGFGLKKYYGIYTWTMWHVIPLSSERTFELHKEICSEIAKNGGHVYFPYDDGRYPLPKADLETVGVGANIDAKYVTRLFQAVKKEYPEFHMVFCPPFYWGPDAPAAYPEPREPYLKSLGEYLDPAIEVFWTGPRVKGYEKNKEQIEWFSGLIGRKPMIFQNGTGPHNLLSYITDETPQWKTWHYDGFFENDIEGFLKNAHMGMEAPQTTTLADCLWNVNGYDATESIRNGVAMLYGRDMFDLLDPANKALAYLDKYKYGEVTPEALTEIPEIERRIAIAEPAYKKGLEYNSFSLQNFPGALGRGVDFAKRLAANAKKAPDFYVKHKNDIQETRLLAEQEVGVDLEKGDIFKSPVDLIGGNFIVYDNKCPKRFASLIRGRKTSIPLVKTSFECDPFPPSGAYELYVSAQDDDAEAQCAIRIKLNDTVIFEGPSKFVRYGWSVEKFILPFESLKRGNLLTIECIEDGDNTSGPPWFMINYMVIKKVEL